VPGIGIDENTAIDVVPGQGFRVLGAGAVTVFDGRVTHTNAADAGDQDTLTLTDSVMHVLAAGYGFDLRRTRPLLPDGTLIEPVVSPEAGQSRVMREQQAAD
jgi:cyanophycinase